MPRNLDQRVEVVFPLVDPAAAAKVVELLELQLHDTIRAGSWTLTERCSGEGWIQLDLRSESVSAPMSRGSSWARSATEKGRPLRSRWGRPGPRAEAQVAGQQPQLGRKSGETQCCE